MVIDAVLTPAEIAGLTSASLEGATCVVFDVLRATSTMLTGLAHGVKAIFPVSTIEEAQALRESSPELLLGGERHGERIEGFELGNSPFEYRDLTGRSVVTTTTNGTVALRACDGAARVFVGAVLNLGALAAELRRTPPERLVLVCAGTFRTFALEDAWAAGKLIDLLPGADLTDSARALLAQIHLYPEPLPALQAARNGRALAARGRGAEVEWCAQLSALDVIGEMKHGRVIALGQEFA